MLPQAVPIRIPSPKYGSPSILRDASFQHSPSSTASMEDRGSDNEESEVAFKRKMEAVIAAVSRDDYIKTDHEPLLPVPTSPTEAKALHERVMKALRARVAKLEEEEAFERMLSRGPLAGYEEQPSSDIRAILQSLAPTHSSGRTIFDPPSEAHEPLQPERPPANGFKSYRSFSNTSADSGFDSGSSTTTTQQGSSRAKRTGLR